MKHLLVFAFLSLASCSSVTMEHKPDGSFKLTSNSFIIDRGIDEATYGTASIKGYKSNTNADVVKAAADGAANGVARAATGRP